MTGYRDFIVKTHQAFNDYIELEDSNKLFLDKRMNPKETVNSIVEVVSVPSGYKGAVKKGYNLFVDPTVFYSQVYTKGGKDESLNLIDRAKGYYKVPLSMVIMYSEGEGTKWNGFDENVLIEKTEETIEKKIGSIIIPLTSKQAKKTEYKVFIGNDKLEVAKEGDSVLIDEKLAVDIHLRGHKYMWLRNKEVLAVIND